jgi:hypothetical protein
VAGRRIDSNKLQGLEIDHDSCGDIAPADSTGSMEQVSGTGNELLDWRIEFLCSSCKSKLLIYNADFRDVMRQVLTDNDIVAQ